MRWMLVDATLDTDERSAVFAQLLHLARSDWAENSTTPRQAIDVEDPVTHALLTQHRVSTMVPTNLARADQRERFRERHLTIAGAQLRLEAVAAQVVTTLQQAGIDSRMLKGMASADLDYPRRHLRQSGDVDIAIRPTDFDATIAALERDGFTHHVTVNSPHLLKGRTLDAPNGVEVDVHTRLFQRSPVRDVLFNEPGEALTSMPGTALSLEHRLVHAAGHFVLAPPGLRRLSGFIDITRMRENPRLDLERARRFASALRVEPLVGAALRLESELAGRDSADLAQLATWRAPNWIDRKTRLEPQRNLTLDHFNRFREVPRSQWLRYLPSWLVPDERLRHKYAQNVSTAVRRSREHRSGRSRED